MPQKRKLTVLMPLTLEARFIWILPTVSNLAGTLVLMELHSLALGIGTARLVLKNKARIQAFIVTADAFAVTISVLGAVGPIDYT